MSRIAQTVLSCFFPNKCLSCGTFFSFSEKAGTYPPFFNKTKKNLNLYLHQNSNDLFYDLMSGFLCKTCIKQFSPVTSPLCPKCGITFNTINDCDHLCHECITSKKYFNQAYSFGIYNRAFRKLIHQFKYNGLIHLAKPFGIFLFYAFYKNHGLDNTDIIAPVPLYIKQMRQRGYNQSYLLIREWPYLLKILKKDKKNCSIKKELLIKFMPSISQTKLDKNQRKLNVKNTFKINPAYNIKGKKILIVDDIFTSGQTADECAKILIKNHAANVNIITLARSVKDISC